MNKHTITVKPFGNNAILVEWPRKVSEAILEDILAFERFLRNKLPTTYEFVPAYNSLCLINQWAIEEQDKLQAKIQHWYSGLDVEKMTERVLWKLPVCYDSEFAIDMDKVSQELNLSPSEIIAEHTSNQFTVFGIGFLPGFMYLGGLPRSLEIPRRKKPRLQVPKGSVGLAGKQTGIYPQQSPGGWNIIGNCPIPIFNVLKNTPVFVNVGDKIQFESISKDKHRLLKIEGEVGIFEPEKAVLHA